LDKLKQCVFNVLELIHTFHEVPFIAAYRPDE
jgi:transcriptional accessory protein Tex/SPT6